MPLSSPVDEYPIVWRPSARQIADSQMADFMGWLGAQRRCRCADYAELWQWSVEAPAAFWAALWTWSGIAASRTWDQVLEGPDRMPGARWFKGARLNFAENLLRFRDGHSALVFEAEDGDRGSLSYSALYAAAGRMAGALQRLGISSGDRVAAILTNGPHAVIAMLASTWLGAVWSSCSPDFGSDAILERFSQIEPRLLICIDGYSYKGRRFDLRDKHAAVLAGLSGDPLHIWIGLQGGSLPQGALDWNSLAEGPDPPPAFAQLPFDHPLYIMFSSGTTGRPKCIVHGAGGTLLQHIKEHRLHSDIGRQDRLFYFTTCGWMMWNWLVSALASGATLVLYDGSPVHPRPDRLWELVDDLEISVCGVSAGYIAAQESAGVVVNGRRAMRSLRSILSTGSPLAAVSYDYLLRDIKPGIQISSISGGTDILSCFALGNPMLPVRRGQLQCRGLGMAVDVFDQAGRPVRDEAGELVCTRPFPSMPIGFWQDPEGARYRAAYFQRFRGVWTHGDWCRLSRDGGLVIDGRSDAVLNPGGVRIGTAEIYRQVQRFPEVLDSVCVAQRWAGDERVILFLVLREGERLDPGLTAAIRSALRTNASPRHVPAHILQVDEVPRTRSGKVSELAVRAVVEGREPGNEQALANPEALAQFSNRPELSLD